MLKSLSISNYALIDQVNLQFKSGFTAITGETGSGKSILLGAFGLLLGERAEAKSIRKSDSKCVVEATFHLAGCNLDSFFEEHDLDYEENTVVRREIAAGGKSRAFINDTPVQLNVLKILGSRLVDIHSQHENSLLGERAFQFEVLDAFSGTEITLKKYRGVFAEWNELRNEREQLQSQLIAWQQEQDYIQYQVQELEKAQLDQLNQEDLESELNTLHHADHIKQALNSTTELLDGIEHSVLTGLTAARTMLSRVSAHASTVSEFQHRLDSSIIELKVLSRDLETFASGVHGDERRAEQIGEQLSLLYQLQKKHRTQTVEELRELLTQMQMRVSSSGELEQRIEQCDKRIAVCEETMMELAIDLDKARQKGAKLAEKEMRNYFTQLSMEHGGSKSATGTQE